MDTDDAPTPERGERISGAGQMTEADAARYMPMLADFPYSEEEKREFLSVIWNILVHFVNMGFDLKEIDLGEHLLEGLDQAERGEGEEELARITQTQSDQEGTP